MTENRNKYVLTLLILALAYLYISIFFESTMLSELLRYIRRDHAEWYGAVHGGAVTLFTACFVGIGSLYHKWNHTTMPRSTWGYLALLVAAALWFPVYAASTVPMSGYMLLFLHGIAVYWLLAVTEHRQESDLSEWAVVDLLRGFVILPFGRFFQLGKEWIGAAVALFQNNEKTEKHGKVWLALVGVAVCIPLLAVVMPILQFADVYFMLAVEGIYDWICQNVFGFMEDMAIFNLFLIGLVGSYLYGLFYQCFFEKKPAVVAKRKAPTALLAGFLVPLIGLYLLFFIIRLLGISGAMDKIAEGHMWVSTYAREGFFELCWIAAINGAVFAIVHRLSIPKSCWIKILLSLLGGETLAFVALAFSKMWYYIQTYGQFTYKRALCCWLLLTMFVAFSLMIAQLWNRKIKGVKWGIVFGCMTFLLMAYSNMAAWVV